ncbi:putative nucleotidyltransferase with HDIG domain [Bacillus niacini]|uniref:Nucleotidyltransferase with HDIG domain n=1 Tax=Neobacillus niacini TaxID=86668 RepID=A0A852THJ7_9BACI|nr:HD-GYP domain-containing protein [Neobacillus niacini]NYE08222.1 putative nucleotidyltransferase with HDIG domain [Neobacillus niacini]
MIPHEEKRTVKWYLLISYVLIIGWDAFYYYIRPMYIKTSEAIGLPDNNKIWYLNYIVLLVILGIAYYLSKVNKQDWIKYIFIISYLTVSFLVDIVSFHGNNDGYTSGNVVEIFLILSLPIFLNTRYFWVVTLGFTLKYIATGILLKTSLVLVPIVLLVILSGLSFFLLVRFQGYVRAVSTSYDNQLEGIVKGVIATLELKDPYTRGHSERVAKYALMFANEIGKFSKEEQKSFYYACLLHDIGKVNIPDQILMKPGKLTDEEFEIIKTHPVVGAEAVKNVEGIKNSIYVIRSHHERWDGKGYPDQLKGEEIPLLARVSAIADAFDAMTSSRSYRDAMPFEEAYNRIIKGQGSQFDPILVDKFKKIYPAWIEFHRNYPWSEKWELLREVE